MANTVGRQLEASGRMGEAMAAFTQALALDPGYLPAASNLARLLVAQDKPRDAVRLLEPIAAGAPFDIALGVNYANALLGVGRAREAEQRLHAVVARPDAPAQAHNSLGVACYVQRRFASAAESFTRAVKNVPQFAEAHENLAQAFLQLGRFDEAWAEYEWRWKNPSNALTKRIFAEPLWDGRPLAGRTLLLHGEQGLGDTIQFARFAALVPKDGATEKGRLVLACQEALVPLMRGRAGLDEVLVLGEALPAFDCQAPLLSLPRLFGTTAATIPAPSRYLGAEPDPDIAAERGVKIGVSWAGRARHTDDPHRNRSCDAAVFVRLGALPGAILYSLQTGTEARESSRVGAIDLAPRIAHFGDTARFVAAMDLVITVDTALAHLAGALGKAVWVLPPYAADWRWTRAGGVKRWYPTARIFHQERPGDWNEVFDRVAAALVAEIRGITNI